MASFTNFATLSYNGVTRTSNTVTGELLEPVSVTQTAVVDAYAAGTDVTLAVSLINSGETDANDLTVEDDLGGYLFDGATVYPLAYREGSVRYYVNGALQSPPAVSGGSVTFSGVDVPAGGNALLVYEATVTPYAPLAAGSTITDTVSVTGASLSAPVTATETLTAAEEAQLRIVKAVSPAVVSANGQLTYTFTVENTGNTAALAADGVVLADTFDPILSALAVSFNGAPWASGTNYTYDAASGAFASVAGQITVPAATYAQNADGTWAVTPGSAALTVSGTVVGTV
ncbi:MAG: DUF11 domain-containing protein [Oscillibacter sp.]|nr:DUF11 domain-containing protein [Oscillibacter sp.]